MAGRRGLAFGDAAVASGCGIWDPKVASSGFLGAQSGVCGREGKEDSIEEC